MLENQQYHLIRKKMQPGDIIAFGGNSLFSRWTKLTTRSVVTHVAIVMQSKVLNDDSGRFFNQVMEATVHGGKKGVMTNRLSERVKHYDGDIWWLPLGKAARKNFDKNRIKFFDFMFTLQNAEYDVLQLFGSAMDCLDQHPLFGQLTYNEEDLSSWFCSELVAEGLKTAEVVEGVNASEVTPVDICRFSIFSKKYFQLKGETKPITGYNSLAPTNWGQIA